METKENLDAFDLEMLADELRYISECIYGACFVWKNEGMPSDDQRISMFGFFTAEQLDSIADSLDQIQKNITA